MEVAQPSSPSLGQRFAALLPLTAGFAAVLAIAGVSLYVLVYLLVPPADEKLAATTALTLKASLTAPEDTPAAAMPAPVKPPEEAVPIVAVAPGALAPGTPAPAAPSEEAAPIDSVAPGAFAPGAAPAVAMPAPAAPPEELRASTAEISALLARGDSLFGLA